MAAKQVSFLNKGSDIVISEYCCSSCGESGHNINAEFYCGNCEKFYCGECMKPHRQLFKTHAVSGREDMERWPLPRETQNLLEKCDVHTHKKVELFCGCHKQLCCITCISSSHRGCTPVSLISDESKSQGDFHQTLSDIKLILDQLIKRQESSKEGIQSTNNAYEERLQEIREMRERINAAIDKLEKTTLEEIRNAQTSLNAPFKADIDTCTKFLEEMKLFCDTIQGKKNNEMSFIAHVKSKEKIKNAKLFLLENPVNVRNVVSFQADKDIEVYLNKQHALGRAITLQLQNPDQVITVQQTERFKLKIHGTSRGSFDIAGVCGLPNGAMIAADNNNNKLLLFDEKYQVVSRCHVPHPYDVCPISNCEVAVTAEDGLHFVSVNAGQLVKGRKLQLGHTCVGIAHLQGSLYVTSYTALYHYKCTGQLVGMLYEDTSGTSTVLGCAISPFGDKIYVTNTQHHKLLTLTKDGTVVSTFTDPELRKPDGVHVSATGQVLVCGNSSNTVMQIDSSGTKKLATLATRADGVLRPVSIYTDSSTNSIVIGQYSACQILVLK